MIVLDHKQVIYLLHSYSFLENIFPLAIILFNSILFAVLISILLYLLNPKKILVNLIIIILSFNFTYFFVPRIMLDVFASSFLILGLIFFLMRNYKLCLLSIFFSSISRPEFIIILIIFSIFLNKNEKIFGFVLSGIIKCQEQTSFFYWSIRRYYQEVYRMNLMEIKMALSERCGVINNKCYINVLIDEIKNHPEKVILHAMKNLITNPLKFLFFPIGKYKKFWLSYTLIIIISIIYSVILILSIIEQRNEKIILYSLFSIVLFYSIFYVFDGSSAIASRFKLHLIPLELYLITKTLSDNQFQLYNYFPSFLQRRKSQDL